MIKDLPFHFNLSELKNYGIRQLSLNDAGILIAFTLFFEEEITINGLELDKDNILLDDNELLLEKLNEVAPKYTEIIAQAIIDGELKTQRIVKNIDGLILTYDTFIDSNDLEKWLESRDINAYDAFEQYYQSEDLLEEQIVASIFTTRLFRIDREKYNEYIQNMDNDAYLKDYYFPNFIKVSDFRNKKRVEKAIERYSINKIDKRERNSLLKLVIGLIANNYGENALANNEIKAKEIADDIQEKTGISMDEDTIRKYLKECKDLQNKLDSKATE